MKGQSPGVNGCRIDRVCASGEHCLLGCHCGGAGARIPSPQSNSCAREHEMVWWGQKLAEHRERVHATLGRLYTSLSCAGSGFLEAEVGPVHSNFLTCLLCRIQTESVRFGDDTEEAQSKMPLPPEPTPRPTCSGH